MRIATGAISTGGNFASSFTEGRNLLLYTSPYLENFFSTIFVHYRDVLALKMNIWRTLESDPTFAQKDAADLKNHRHLTFQKVKRLLELNFVPFEEAMTEPAKSMAWVGAVGKPCILVLDFQAKFFSDF